MRPCSCAGGEHALGVDEEDGDLRAVLLHEVQRLRPQPDALGAGLDGWSDFEAALHPYNLTRSLASKYDPKVGHARSAQGCSKPAGAHHVNSPCRR